jgi:amino acid adenylation domain-containing protein
MSADIKENLRQAAYVPKTLLDVLNLRVSSHPEKAAYTFLEDGEKIEASLTYTELAQKAMAIGAWLQSLGLAGERVMLLYPSGLDFILAFLGCLYAGAVAAPAPSPRNRGNLLRLQMIAADAQVSAALTTSKLAPLVAQLSAGDARTKGLRCETIEDVQLDWAKEWKDPQIDPSTVAFLQYTSGSTASPKGVMVSHANVIANEQSIQVAFNQSERSVILGWLPLYHDMGLIGIVLQTLYLGASCILMPPASFLQEPLKWLKAITRFGVTTSGGPNFGYELCLRKIKPEDRAGLNLSNWTVAFNGAEPIRAETLDRFASTFEPYGFRREAFSPCYGLAEATLLVAGGMKQTAPVVRVFDETELGRGRAQEVAGRGRTLVSCGRSLTSDGVCIVNTISLALCPAGEVGEIWIADASVAKGYFRRQEETESTFRARIAGRDEEIFLRTGDLGFFHDGELFVTGRIKDLIISRGFNHYPQDIERTVERCHEALRPSCGAAFSVDTGNEERVVVVQEVNSGKGPQLDLIFDAILHALAEDHGVRPYTIVLIRRGAIPKTSSGKTQRQECRRRFIAGELPVVGEWREVSVTESDQCQPDWAVRVISLEAIEGWLTNRVAVSQRMQPHQVKLEKPLTHYGLDSLAAIELTHEIAKEFGARLSAESLLQGASIGEIAKRAIAEISSSRLAPAPTAELGADEAPLTYGQRALWFLHQLRPNISAYNVVSAVRIDSRLDVNVLSAAFKCLVERHPSLRTTFFTRGGEPWQRINRSLEIPVAEEEANGWSEELLKERILQSSQQPFDLEQGKLLRLRLYHCSGQQEILALVAHHIVVDFWSLAVLMKELGASYSQVLTGEGILPPPPKFRYVDFARHQITSLAGPEGERLRSYWSEQLAGELPTLNLPTDRPRPPIQTFNGASTRFKVDADLTGRLRRLSREYETTLYTTMLAAFQALLYRYTEQRDILVGSPVAGRNLSEWADIVGYFVNPVVMRGQPAGELSFNRFLVDTRQVVLAALAHQDYPFALLVEQLQPERSASQSPVFQVMFTMQKTLSLGGENIATFALGENGNAARLNHLTVHSITLDQPATQFDLTLSIVEQGDELSASFQYNTDLFDAATVTRFGGHYRNILESIAADPCRQIGRMRLLNEAERRQILVDWNSTYVDYGQRKCLQQLFESQVERRPNDVALIFEERGVTNRELNRRANQVATHLRKLGVGPDIHVGICMERSIEMVVGLLAILKAGGAYVPLDPTYPRERLKYMLSDSSITTLITQRHIADRLTQFKAQILCLDADWNTFASGSDENFDSGVGPDTLAYTIYTSGSTGDPKGVMITHGGIYNRLSWMQEQYRLGAGDRVLHKTPFSFDVSVWEFFWPLMTRATMVIAKPGGHHDPDYLFRLINDQLVTTIHFVPSMLQVFLESVRVEQCRSLRRVICSGEALPIELQNKFLGRSRASLSNLYGPTEASVDVSFWECRQIKNQRSVPIGYPIANTQLFVLDQYLQPAPVGVSGELYISGVGIARGYLDRAGLTAERFVPNPYGTRPGERIYRTGDLARRLPGGEIEFLGRIDDQIKIRGFRIELGEIEAALKGHPLVSDAVVAARPEINGERRLVGYLVTKAGAPTNRELREFLKKRLPEYMAPSSFLFLEELPLSSNGKIDRKRLPNFELQKRDERQAFVAPRTPLEETLVMIWEQVLSVEGVGIEDNFYELGGHSLLIPKIAAKVREILDVELPLQVWFERPTIAGQADAINERQAQHDRADDISKLLEALDQMSEEEVDALLLRREGTFAGQPF